MNLEKINYDSINNPQIKKLSYPPINSKIDERYKCPLCKNIMIDVHQADDCGCRFCLECLRNM